MAVSSAFWKGRKVLLTGHTGFKGGWLALWLRQLGADLRGVSLPAATTPSLWDVAQLAQQIPGEFTDIRDSIRLTAAVQAFQPELVLHLAAQPLVRESYREPAQTYATNVMGTINLLEAIRSTASVRAVVVVTTDKCYENREWPWPYREQDTLGGFDPYSSSKACVELVCASYRDAFLRSSGVALATARAGNVLGGGDWSQERLVPDVFRAWQEGREVLLRYPHAIRPWQHVLDPLMGYLQLAQRLFTDPERYASAWNFGPDSTGLATVEAVVGRLAELWPGEARWSVSKDAQPHEAGLLTLDSSKARQSLDWMPRWSLETTLKQTLDWQLSWIDGRGMDVVTCEQIAVHQGRVK